MLHETNSGQGVDADMAVAVASLPLNLTCAEAAEFARVDPRTIRRWIAAKRLLVARTHPSRGKILVPRDALLRLLTGKG